jgi:hypothetical protein
VKTEQNSFTAKDAKGAKENKSLTAKDAKAAKEYFRTATSKPWSASFLAKNAALSKKSGRFWWR